MRLGRLSSVHGELYQAAYPECVSMEIAVEGQHRDAILPGTQPHPMDGPLSCHSGLVWSTCGKPTAQRTIKEAGGVSNQSWMVPSGVSLARLSQSRIPLQSHRAVWPHAPGSPSALKEKPYDIRRGHRIGKGSTWGFPLTGRHQEIPNPVHGALYFNKRGRTCFGSGSLCAETLLGASRLLSLI